MNDDKRITLAYEIIADVRRLIDRVDEQYGEKVLSVGYKAMIGRVRNATLAQYVHGPWQSVSQQLIGNENLVLLEAIADSLPHEGDSEPFENIQAIATEIDTLLLRLSESSLPPYHKFYARMMLERVQRSMRSYILFGAEAALDYAAFVQGIDADLKSKAETFENEYSQVSPDDQNLLTRIVSVSHKVAEWSKHTYYVTHAVPMLYNLGVSTLQLFSRL